MKKSRKGREKRKGRMPGYVAEAAVLGAVVLAALWIPQIIFGLQDGILCRDTTLGQKESMDVEALSTTYEKSLAQRMKSFAEGLGEGDSYYVTSQNLSISEVLTNYLASASGLGQEIFTIFIGNNLLSPDIWSEYTPTQWKQYVVYSDNYAKGVNFILWYVELESYGGEVLKLLCDAEDGTIYAVKAENNTSMDKVPKREYDYLREAFWDESVAVEMWGFLAFHFEALQDSEMAYFWELAEKMGWKEEWDVSDAAAIEPDAVLTGTENTEMGLQQKIRYGMEGNDKMVFWMPFGEGTLEIVLEVPDQKEIPIYFYVYPDITIGVYEIYEMIPEFA